MFTLTNGGSANLLVGAVTLAGANADAFALTGDGCSGQTLAPAASCQVSVVFDPSSTGVKSASLRVVDNAAGSPHTAGLTGTGIEAPAPTPAPALTPALASLSPASGPVGTVVAVVGEGLTDATVVAVVVVGSGGASNPLTFTSSGAGGMSGPAPCDPLVSACAGGAPEQAGAPALAPAAGGDGGAAVGHARTPNLRASVSARWQAGTIRVTVRVLISKSRLVTRSFLVRVRIPALDTTRLVRVRAHGKRVRTLQLAFTAPASATGNHVVVAVDPTKRVLETRERDNGAHARIR